MPAYLARQVVDDPTVRSNHLVNYCAAQVSERHAAESLAISSGRHHSLARRMGIDQRKCSPTDVLPVGSIENKLRFTVHDAPDPTLRKAQGSGRTLKAAA